MEKLTARRSLGTIAAAGCTAALATVALGRRRARQRPSADPPDRALADDMMDGLATGEGMPEAREG
jgi:hypothetical protein